jgi:hypothetical protein
VTNAPLADITTESLFSFDLKNREEMIQYGILKYIKVWNTKVFQPGEQSS